MAKSMLLHGSSSTGMAAAAALLLSHVLPYVASQVTTVNDMPSFNSNDGVDFYYCESSFPYNAPASIVKAAGEDFALYSTAIAGLGIWDTTTNTKLTVQFVSDSYVGGLLPVLTDNPAGSGGYIFWNNTGRVVITSPLNADQWTNSRHISTASGVAYQDLVDYLQDNQNEFTVYQPVTVVQPTSAIIDEGSSAYQGNTDNGLGTVMLAPQNSYTFVNTMMSQLASFGVDLTTFLNTYDNSFAYLMANETSLETVEWDTGGLANEDVYNWFKALNSCYSTAFTDAQTNGEGAQYFIEYLGEHCYNIASGGSISGNGNGAYAYVYKSATSVYKVYLMNFSSYTTPELFRSIYTLPSTPSNEHASLDAIDYVIIVIFILVIFGVIYFFSKKFFTKGQRRRVSFEGERIAEIAVAARTEAEADEEGSYYNNRDSLTQRHLLQTRQNTLQSLLSFGGTKKGSLSRTDLNTRLDPENTN